MMNGDAYHADRRTGPPGPTRRRPSNRPFVPLADELFLVLLDESTGRFLAARSIVALSLAAGLIAELAAHLDVSGDRLIVVGRKPPQDALTHKILDQMAGESRTHPTHDWLAFFSQNSVDQISERMASRGLIRIESRRRLLSKEELYFTDDPSTAAWPLVRLRRYLTQPDPAPLTGRDAFLMVATDATGLRQELIEHGSQDGREMARSRLDAIRKQVPNPWGHLAQHLAAAVGTAVQTHRT